MRRVTCASEALLRAALPLFGAELLDQHTRSKVSAVFCGDVESGATFAILGTNARALLCYQQTQCFSVVMFSGIMEGG